MATDPSPLPRPVTPPPSPPIVDSHITTIQPWPACKKRTLNPVQGLVASVMNFLEDRVFSPLEARKPLHRCVDPAVQLAGNFAPVLESPPVRDLRIRCEIPPAMAGGVYVRNGANLMLPPRGGHHLFDGDGMLHAVALPDGGATTRRFTRTSRLAQEAALGRCAFSKAIGELHLGGHAELGRLLLFGLRAAAGVVDASRGAGAANTGLVYFIRRAAPRAVGGRPAVPRRRRSRRRPLHRRAVRLRRAAPVTDDRAPKVDPDAGELFALSYDVARRPYLRYFRVDPHSGEKSGGAVAVALGRPTMVHDFAVTSRYAVIPDQQMVFDLYMADATWRLSCHPRRRQDVPFRTPPTLNLEAGTVNQSRLGRCTRYAYLAVAEVPWRG
ncbi:hypothetical protein E2562_010588 [Oryza meyeriana var. granulata]|uniref:Uncharacterized protein n=1 Tax=Oryza meyeriana var. granulata TaxID=110450 RepID=A0A6G1BUC6_9ORYZ|nr:hypothetical protein E2562_010588 [Oryza meyeriana var. granulata]